jgi:hypothetical protein
MFSAIATVLSKTIDVYLKMNSSEAARRRFGRDIFRVYEGLDELAAAMSETAILIESAADVANMDDLLRLISREAERTNAAIGKVAGAMRIESMDLFQARRSEGALRRIGIYDPELVDRFLDAWFFDGGFVEALLHLGLHEDFDRHVLRLRDVEFDPALHGFAATPGYAVEPEDAVYDLAVPQNRAELIELARTSQAAVEVSRDSVRDFIAKRLSIEDVL